MCAFFQLWSFENYTSNFRPHLRHKISRSFSPSLLLPPLIFSYLQALIYGFLWWWALFLTRLLLEVASLIIFLPSPFHRHCSSRSKRTPLMKKIQGLQAPHGAISAAEDLKQLTQKIRGQLEDSITQKVT